MWQLQTHLAPFCAWKSLLTCSAGAYTTSSANDPTTTTGLSTIDAVLALRLLSEPHRQFSRPLYVAFVDIKSTFDSVDRNALWKALCARGIPDILLHLIKDQHTHTSYWSYSQNR